MAPGTSAASDREDSIKGAFADLLCVPKESIEVTPTTAKTPQFQRYGMSVNATNYKSVLASPRMIDESANLLVTWLAAHSLAHRWISHPSKKPYRIVFSVGFGLLLAMVIAGLGTAWAREKLGWTVSGWVLMVLALLGLLLFFMLTLAGMGMRDELELEIEQRADLLAHQWGYPLTESVAAAISAAYPGFSNSEYIDRCLILPQDRITSQRHPIHPEWCERCRENNHKSCTAARMKVFRKDCKCDSTEHEALGNRDVFVAMDAFRAIPGRLHIAENVGKLLILSPVFIALKILIESGFNIDVAIAMLTGLSPSTFVQVVALQVVLLVSVLGSLYFLYLTGKCVREIRTGKSVVAVMFVAMYGAVVFTILPQVLLARAWQPPEWVAAVGILLPLLVAMAGGFGSGDRAGLSEYGWAVLFAVVANLVALPYAFTALADQALIEGILVPMMAIGAGLFRPKGIRSLFLFTSVVVAGIMLIVQPFYWLPRESVVITGMGDESVEMVELRRDGNDSIILLPMNRTVLRVSDGDMSKREFCRSNQQTVADVLLGSPEIDPCP